MVDIDAFNHHKNMVRYEFNDGESIDVVRYLVRIREHGKNND